MTSRGTILKGPGTKRFLKRVVTAPSYYKTFERVGGCDLPFNTRVVVLEKTPRYKQFERCDGIQNMVLKKGVVTSLRVYSMGGGRDLSALAGREKIRLKGVHRSPVVPVSHSGLRII